MDTFQSRAGFSECLDAISSGVGVLDDEFQSRAGFSECLDDLVGRFLRSSQHVSIPCWVF